MAAEPATGEQFPIAPSAEGAKHDPWAGPAAPPDGWPRVRPAMIESGGLIVNAGYQAALAEAGLTDLDAIFNFTGGRRLVKRGLPPHRLRDRVVLADGRIIFLKRYQPGRWRRIRRSLTPGVGRSEAADEWRALWLLADDGIAVPAPVLLGPSASGEAAGAGGRSCIALAKLPDAWPLEDWLAKFGPGLPPDRWEILFAQLADFIARFHSLGTVHRDLYASHVFISWPGWQPAGDSKAGQMPASDQPAFRLIDLARVFRPTALWRRRWIVKDLAQLRFSLRGQMTEAQWREFLRRYHGSDYSPRLVAQIEWKAGRIAHHTRKVLRA